MSWPSTRGLRSHLLDTFSYLHILDLHGDSDKRETTESGAPDENVFEIKHGVAVATMARVAMHHDAIGPKGAAFRQDLRGSRAAKYDWLLSNSQGTSSWKPLSPRPDRYLFMAEDVAIAMEYEKFDPVKELLDVNSTGFESGRDEILTAFTKDELNSKLMRFATAPLAEVRKEFNVDSGWGAVLLNEREGILDDPAYESRFRPFLFGPYDVRWCFYRKDLLKTNSFSAGRHMVYGPNLALVVMRQVSIDAAYSHVGISDLIVNNRCFYSTKGKVSYFPVSLYAGETDLLRDRSDVVGSNFRATAMKRWAKNLGIMWAPGAPKGHAEDGVLTELDAIRYILAALHSSSYRLRYSAMLRLEFPRVPEPRNLSLFRELVELGDRLIGLHLLRPSAIPQAQRLAAFVGDRAAAIDRASWSDGSVWLNKAKSAGFSGVPESIWEFHVGGYQVCKKWLNDRKGRTLSGDEVTRYEAIVGALSGIICVMSDVDDVIDRYGGWPDAFRTTGGVDSGIESRGPGDGALRLPGSLVVDDERRR